MAKAFGAVSVIRAMKNALLSLYGLALIVCAGVTVWRFWQPAPVFQTDIQALSQSQAQPAQMGSAAANEAAVMSAAIAAYEAQATNTLVLMLGPASPGALASQFEAVPPLLAPLGLENLTLNAEQQSKSSRDYLMSHRYPLLPHYVQNSLAMDSDAFWMARVQRNLMQPGGGGVEDPLGLTARTNLSTGVPDQGFLRFQKGGEYYAISVWRLPASPFDMGLQTQLEEALAAIRVQLGSAERLKTAGVVVHAAAAGKSAQQEIKWLGGLSMLGIVLLAWWAFGGAFSILAVALVVSAAMASGFVAVVALLGSMHVLGLLLASSVIGMSVDYVLHYFCDLSDANKKTYKATSHVRNGVLMAALTSLSGYLVLFGSAPLMSQLAVFTAVGLATAALSTLYLLPKLNLNTRASSPALLEWLAQRRLHKAWLLPVVLAGLGVFAMQSDNFPGNFYYQTPQLQNEQAEVQAVVGQSEHQSVFLLQAKDGQALLQMDSELSLVIQQDFPEASLRNLSEYLPPASLQAQRLALARDRLLDKGLLAKMAATFGLGEAWLSSQVAMLAPVGDAKLEFSPAVLRSLPEGRGSLYLQPACDCVASILTVSGISGDKLERYVADGVQLVQPLKFAEAGLNALQSDLLKRAVWVWLVMLGVLLWRYGRKAVIILLAPTVAVMAAAGVLSWAGIALNLFHMAGLMVTVGLGVDYQIFRHEAGQQPQSQQQVGMAIWLSVATTSLAFGLLMVSETPAVAAFGEAVVLGLLFNTMLAFVSPTARPLDKERLV